MDRIDLFKNITGHTMADERLYTFPTSLPLLYTICFSELCERLSDSTCPKNFIISPQNVRSFKKITALFETILL